MSTTSRSGRSDRAAAWLRGCSRLAIAAWLAWPSTAFAKDSDIVDLTWRAPEGCPSAEAVLARLRQLAGDARPGAAPLKAEATVTEDADHQLELKLILRSGNLVGTRNIKARSCGDLVGAVAVALALLLSPDEPLDQSALGEPSPDEATPRPPTRPEQTPPQNQATPPETPRAPETDEPDESTSGTHGIIVLPLGALSIGPQRRSLFGVGVAGGASVDQWRFYAEGKLWRSRNATAAEDEESGASLKQFTLSLRGCRNVGGSRLEVSPCLLVSLQHLAAQGTGPHIAPQTPDATWVAAGVGLRARFVAAPWLGLFAGVDGEVQTSRPQVTLEGVGSVERLSQFGATVAVGSEWIL